MLVDRIYPRRILNRPDLPGTPMCFKEQPMKLQRAHSKRSLVNGSYSRSLPPWPGDRARHVGDEKRRKNQALFRLRQQWWLPSASGHHCKNAVSLGIEPLAQKFLGFGYFSVPLDELLGIQKLSNALMNLAAMLFHFGNNVGFGCVGVRLHVCPDLF